MPSHHPSSASTGSTVEAPARAFDAVVFDMDGVVTRTAEVHAAAWRRMFDAFLQRRSARPFVYPDDYLEFIDGRPRYDGVAAFLASRNITLPVGGPTDAPGDESVCALGNWKNALFNEILEAEGVAVFASTVELIAALKAEGVCIGLATSSRNAARVLNQSGTAALFECVVDGLVSERLGLKGKPEPDIFLRACAQLGVAPERTIVVEDAVTGVKAGRSGGFAFTIGLAREDNAAELREHGADLVLGDLAEIALSDLHALVLARREPQP